MRKEQASFPTAGELYALEMAARRARAQWVGTVFSAAFAALKSFVSRAGSPRTGAVRHA